MTLSTSFMFPIIIAALFVAVAIMYNKGVTLRNYVKEAFSTMDVYLKKRWDLIPNLLETVKGYSNFEQSTLKSITELRNKNYTNLSADEKISVNSQLSMGLSRLIAVAENYPDLKANQTYAKLMTELSDIENDIANSRKYYNGTVREFNNYTELFPTNLVAAAFGFKSQKMFEISEAERQNVEVKF